MPKAFGPDICPYDKITICKMKYFNTRYFKGEKHRIEETMAKMVKRINAKRKRNKLPETSFKVCDNCKDGKQVKFIC